MQGFDPGGSVPVSQCASGAQLPDALRKSERAAAQTQCSWMDDSLVGAGLDHHLLRL